jgi:hypothetical protein
MPWKKIVLDGDDIRRGIGDRIQEAFVERIAEAGWPEDAIMYGNQNEWEGEQTYYFPPSAVKAAPELLSVYDAIDCLAPDLSQLKPVVFRTPGGRRDL